jgi:hypothetical protein
VLIYTDLKDSSGKEIYSNSIILVPDDNEKIASGIGPIYFSKGSFMWGNRLLASISEFSILVGTTNDKNENWFSDIDRYHTETFEKGLYDEDTKRIQSILVKIGIDKGFDFARTLWIKYSEGFLSGWVYLPKEDSELKSLLTDYIEKEIEKRHEK